MIRTTWAVDRERLRAVRHTVFVIEQHVEESEEWDDADSECSHVLALSGDQEPIGTGRLDPKGKIGRMAVLAAWRGRDIGKRIMETLLGIARDQGFKRVYLNSQIAARGFYEQFGFVAVGEPFTEANILHVRMERETLDG